MFAADLEQNNLKVTANASCISFVELFRPMVNCVCLVSSIGGFVNISFFVLGSCSFF